MLAVHAFVSRPVASASLSSTSGRGFPSSENRSSMKVHATRCADYEITVRPDCVNFCWKIVRMNLNVELKPAHGVNHPVNV